MFETPEHTTAPSPESSGGSIGPYRILRNLGRGGQGTVYLAEDISLRRRVALKVLDAGLTADPEATARFRREAEITSRLDNPGICAVYATGEDRGSFWIAMRYVEGDSLAKMISTAKEGRTSSDTTFVLASEDAAHSGAVPVRPDSDSTGPRTWADISRVLSLFEEAARTLHVAHEAGVIHRDIKPGNMIVTKDGHPVILDFGLAQEVQGDQPTLTLTGNLMGTPAYMSPEQIAAQRITLDRRTDVYSLGVSLYECLALQRPFDAPTREGLYQAILTKEPPDLRQLNRAIPGDLRIVVATALEKDRDRRYQTALDLAEELRRIRMHEPIVAKPVGKLVRLQRWARRNPALATALVGLFVVLVVGQSVALVLLSQTRHERDAKEAERLRADRNATEKTTALAEKSAALDDFERLGDLSRLQTLTADADTLWPCQPSQVRAMKAWIDRATDLEQRLASHRETLAKLRASPTVAPYSDDDRDADVAAHQADEAALSAALKNREHLAGTVRAAEGGTSDPATRPSVDQLQAMLKVTETNISGLNARIHQRLTWRFQNPSEQFRHDTTARLVAALTDFLDADPHQRRLADIRARLAFAETVERETIDNHATEWSTAIQSIGSTAECPRYGGLRIKPQLGLIPIGKDEQSGLWEFAHLFTTQRATEKPIPRRLANGRLEITDSMGLVFVLVPGGTFRMGAIMPSDEDTPLNQPNVDRESIHKEAPIVSVSLDPFFMSKFEMTQAQWTRVTGKNNSVFGPGHWFGTKVTDARNPVEQVTWTECDLWLRRLGLSLPTEAQWEYAARAGTTTPRWTGIGTEGLGASENLYDRYAVNNGGPQRHVYELWDDGFTVHAPVGTFLPNPFGLHDVLGNVSEWCLDGFAPYEVVPEPGTGLRRSEKSGSDRVLRGGSFTDDASNARSAMRQMFHVSNRDSNVGLRPARALDR